MSLEKVFHVFFIKFFTFVLLKPSDLKKKKLKFLNYGRSTFSGNLLNF